MYRPTLSASTKNDNKYIMPRVCSICRFNRFAITFCGKADNSKQRFAIRADIACGNSCLIISATTVAKQAVNQGGRLLPVAG